MQETVLLYKIDKTEAGKAIISLLNKLNVKVVIVKTKDLMQSVGYLLGQESYEANKDRIKEVPNDHFMALYGFEEKQIEVLFQIFEEANIPYIPLKTKITDANISSTFLELLKKVRAEYIHISGINKDINLM